MILENHSNTQKKPQGRLQPEVVASLNVSNQDSFFNRFERAAKLPHADKQKFLDAIRAGKTIGEAKDALGWDLYLALAVLDQNIVECSYLRTEAR